MKKSYISPEMEIEKFNFPNSAITTSEYNPGQSRPGTDTDDPFAQSNALFDKTEY